MEAALATKPGEKKKVVRLAADAFTEAEPQQGECGATAGLPLFLGVGLQKQLPVGAVAEPLIQAKCAKCEEEEEEQARRASGNGSQVQTKCAECQEEEDEEARRAGQAVQTKCAGCGGGTSRHNHQDHVRDSQPAGVHNTARDGVAGASQPLPHLNRIQSSFGRHDVNAARTEIGGPAAQANERMGSLAFTAGDRIGFRHEPDVKLAAHEAAHVVQQRSGAKLPGGVGRPGDEYEQQADAAAEAVDRGESAEPILDRSIPGGPSGGAPVVQHRLEVNAIREFEPPVVSSGELGSGGREPVRAGGAGAPAASGKRATQGGPPAADKGDAEAEDGTKEGQAGGKGGPQAGGSRAAQPGQSAQGGLQSSGNGTAQGGSQGGSRAAAQPAPSAQGAPPSSGNAPLQPQSPAPGGPQGAAPANGGGGGGTQTPGGNQATCAGGGIAKCYDAPSEQPAKEPAEKPPNPAGTEVQEETSAGDEEDLPEPDDCAAQETQAGPAGAAGGPAPAPGAPGAAPGGGPVPAGPAALAPASAPAKGSPASATGGDGAPGGGGVSPGGTPEAAVQSVASPLEGAIALSEGQRGAAVADYAASSAALAAASDGTQALRGNIQFAPSSRESTEDAIRREAAAVRAENFFSEAAVHIDRAIAFASGRVPDRLGEQAESAKAQIAASVEIQKNAISGSIERARGQAGVQAALARATVTSQAASFVASAEAQTASAIAELTATHAGTMGQVDELETSTLGSVNQIYGQGRTQLEGLGTTVGGECTTTGEQFAATYEGFAHCTVNGFWDGDLSERRAHAQAEAARKTAKGYHDRIVESAKKRAREIAKDGRKKDRCGVIAAAKHAREALDQNLASLTTALATARDAAIEQAGSTRDSLIASIDSGLAATLRQLDQTEHDQRQSADDTGYVQQVLQEQLAHTGAAALQRAVVSAATALQTTLLDLQYRFSGSNPPDVDALDKALTVVTQRIGAGMSGLQTSLEGGTAQLEQQLGGAAGAGLAALLGVTRSSNEMVGALSGGFSSSMGAITGRDNFAAQRAGFSQQVQQASSAGTAALAQAFGGMRQGCDSITAESHKALSQASADLERNLRQSKQGLECEITQRADEAASHEAPAWKMLVAILLVIVVIVIIIAVTVLTAGMALGPLAMIGVGILIGAAVGAVTSGLLAIAGNLWSNKEWSTGVAHAVLVGAITGAIGGGIGAGVGVALKSASLVVQYGAAMVTAGVLDSVTQIVMGGVKNFSWTNLGLTLVITALTLGLAHGVATTRADAAPAGAGEGARPTIEPTAQPAELVPTPTEPTVHPTEPVTAPAEPAEPIGQPSGPPATPEPVPPGRPQPMGTVSAGPEGIVEHPTPTPTVESAPPGRRVPSAPPEASATPEAPQPMREHSAPRGSTSEEIAEVMSEQTSTTPETEQREFEAHAEDVPEQMNPRTSASTTGPEREQAAVEAAERGPHPDDMRGNEAEIGSTVPEEIPEGNMFEPEVTEPLTPQRARDAYMGSTPDKYSETGSAVVERMRSLGQIRGKGPLLPGNPNGLEVLAPDGTWHLIDETIDMAHYPVDAVKYWNEEGRFYGARSEPVREFMTDPDNYRLEPRSSNRSAGAKLGETYLPPEK